MERVEKTIFLSYRRTNAFGALAVFQNLTQHGYDVFFDFNGLASGDFERVIVENIKARAHFLVLLTPSALERCQDPGDWLRREIETALAHRRNIVPLLLEGFDFSAPAIGSQLTGSIAPLKQYNSVRIPPDYFDEAMERLRTKFLNVPVGSVIHPASPFAQQVARTEKTAATAEPVVKEKELTAEQWAERAFAASNPDERIDFYSEAIRLKPDYAVAFYNRGVAWKDKGDFDGAYKDYNEAIRLKPDYADAFINRGVARHHKGDFEGAIKDYSEGIRLTPGDAVAFNNRGIARYDKGDIEGSMKDYNEAIRLEPDFADAFHNRGLARIAMGDVEGALEDYDEAIRLKPRDAEAFDNRGAARKAKGDLAGADEDFKQAERLKAAAAGA